MRAFIFNLNTSHVIVQPRFSFSPEWMGTNLNTSHVIVQPGIEEVTQAELAYLNTSHVIVQPTFFRSFSYKLSSTSLILSQFSLILPAN